MKNQELSKKKADITAVIPAFNEADSIGEVLDTLREVPEIKRILVVDDGSLDNTTVVVNAYKSKDKRLFLLSHTQNQGKAAALFTGAAASQSELLLFLDADLKGFRPYHIKNLIQPVQEGNCAMAVGLFADGRWTTNLTHHLFPFLSGQRCLRRSLFQDLYRENVTGWSIETALNLHAWTKDYQVTYVLWPGVTHAIRTEKRAGLAGYWSHIIMWREIGQYTLHFMISRARQEWVSGHVPHKSRTPLKFSKQKVKNDWV